MDTYSPFVADLPLIPVRHEVVTIAGVPTHYWEYGPTNRAIDLVMIHGFRGDHHGLEAIVSQLGPDVRIVIPDLPGFGLSAELTPHNDIESFTNWLKAFWGALGIRPSTCLLGHSFGSIVVSATLAAGLNVDRVILVNPIAANALMGPKRFLTKIAVGYYKLSAALPEGFGNWLLRNQAVVRGMSVAMAKTNDKSLRKWIHHQHKMYFSIFSSRKSLLESFNTSVSHDVSEYAKDIQQDVLMIVADRDDITALPAQFNLADQLKSSQVEVITGVGHLVHYEAPQLAAEWILRFIQAPRPDSKARKTAPRKRISKTTASAQ